MASDAEKFGAIVDSLVGCACERTLATNSIKLRFETDLDPRGRKYIWIDPPWRLVSADGLVTSSDDYDGDHFHEWSKLFAPLDNTFLESWRVGDDRGVVFTFANGYRILVPWSAAERQNADWYAHWYACDSTA